MTLTLKQACRKWPSPFHSLGCLLAGTKAWMGPACGVLLHDRKHLPVVQNHIHRLSGLPNVKLLLHILDQVHVSLLWM